MKQIMVKWRKEENLPQIETESKNMIKEDGEKLFTYLKY